jgi:hypothetical protein
MKRENGRKLVLNKETLAKESLVKVVGGDGTPNLTSHPAACSVTQVTCPIGVCSAGCH